MRIVYASGSEIGVPLLEALFKNGHECLVLTSPDAPGKRGRTLIPPAVKVKAEELGIEVYQPETLRTEARERIASFSPDLLLSFSYGKIFGPRFLSLFAHTMNVHPSLLPRYRGCSPIYSAVRNNDRETGITLQKIAEGIDEGDVYRQLRIALDGTETTASLEEKVAHLAPSIVLEALDDLSSFSPQEGVPSYTSFIKKEDGKLDFSRPWYELHAQIRACLPWPKAYVTIDGEELYITGVSGSSFEEGEDVAQLPGTVIALDRKKGLKIASVGGYLYITRVLPPKRKEMDAASYINGNRGVIGRRIDL